MLHMFLLGIAFGAITVFGLCGAVRLDRYEADREAEWRLRTPDEPTTGEKSGGEAGTAFVATSPPTLSLIDGGADGHAG